jgi:uncharacterized protein YhhL (DUF1145 family)
MTSFSPFNQPLDRFIKITEAAEILGYAHYRSVIMLIDSNILPSYELPHVTRKRVLLSEVLELLKTKESEDKNQENKKKKGRGRPRKFG